MSNNTFGECVKLLILLLIPLDASCAQLPHAVPTAPVNNVPIIETLPTIPKYVPTPSLPKVIAEPPIVTGKDNTLPTNSPEVTELGDSIISWKRKTDHNIWWECGVKYDKEQIKIAAYAWADALVSAHKKTTYSVRWGRHKGKPLKVNMREATGVIINESRFDRCAIGPYPRKFAYKKGILERK